MKKNIFFTIIFLFIVLSFSCNKCNKDKSSVTKVELAKVDTMNIKIHCYEKALFAVDTKNLKEGLEKLLPEYSFFIPDSALKDSLNLHQMKSFLSDPFILALNDDCNKIFPDVKDLESQFNKAFTYFKHYFPEKHIPKVFTCVSGFYYEEPIRFADSILIISLDMYMGSNYKYYKEMLGLPLYMQRKFRRDYILPDCMIEIAKTVVDNSKEGKGLVDVIIYEGKKMYFLDTMLPDTPDSVKIEYSSSQMDWCLRNETNIWSTIIDKKLLYSTDNNMISKFCRDAPFTLFFSKQSPARVGIWIGWQIVRSYMENNKKVTIKELFANQDAQDILTKSKYKPKK